MCPPPFDPVHQLGYLSIPTRWFVLGTAAELGLFLIVRGRRKRLARRLDGAARVVPGEPDEVRPPRPWLESLAMATPVLALVASLWSCPVPDSRRGIQRIAADASIAAVVATWGAVCLASAVAVLCAAWIYRWEAKRPIQASAASSGTDAPAASLLIAARSNQQLLVKATTTAVFGGMLPASIGVLMYVNAAFPWPPNFWHGVPSRIAIWSWHWDLITRCRPFLVATLSLSALAFVRAAVDWTRAIELSAGATVVAKQSLRRMLQFPAHWCLVSGGTALALAGWLSIKSAPLFAELLAWALDDDYNWTVGEALPELNAPEGEGPDEFVEAPQVQLRDHSPMIDGAKLAPEELYVRLKTQRDLWLAIYRNRVFPGLLTLTADEDAPAAEILNYLAELRSIGFHHVQFPLRRCSRKNRPLLGPVVGCHWSAVNAGLFPSREAKCIDAPSQRQFGALVRELVRLKSEAGSISICSQ